MPTTLNSPSAPAKEGDDLWYTRCAVPTTFGLAVHLGYLDQEFDESSGIGFTAIQTSPDPTVHQSHYTHTQPNSFRHGGNYPAIWAHANGADTRIIGATWLDFPQSIVALPGSGVRSAADLKGKRLLLLKRANEPIDFWYALQLRIYEKALASVGLTAEDVHFVETIVDRQFISDHNGASASRNEAVSRTKGQSWIVDNAGPLIRGEADVVATQFAHLQTFLGAETIFDLASFPDRLDRVNNDFPYVFAVKADLIERRPDLVARVYARVLEAQEWARHNPSDAVRAIGREHIASEDLIEKTFPQLVQGLEIGLDPDLPEALRRQKDFLLRRGLIQNDFDVAKWIDPRPLEDARKLLEERRVQGTPVSSPRQAQGVR